METDAGNFILANGSVAHNCKAHAVSYMFVAYACAWLKHHYPLEWWCSVLNNAKRKEIDEKFWKECGHWVLMPDIHASKDGFSIEGDRIRAPLSMLHGVGRKAHKQLMEYGPYTSIEHFLLQIEKYKDDHAKPVQKKDKDGNLKEGIRKGTSAINNSVIGNLIVSGAMDSLFPARMSMQIGSETIDMPVDLVDRLNIFEEERARIKGARKKNEVSLAAKYSINSPMEQYQIRKAVLPAYAAPLLPLVLDARKSLFLNQNTHYEFVQGQRRYVVMDGKKLDFIEHDTLLPLGDLSMAVPYYVLKAEKRNYTKDNQKREAVDLVLDSEGSRLVLTRWGGERGLPGGIKEVVPGCVIMALFSKRAGKDLFLENAIVVQKPLDSSKEESA